MKPDHQNRFSAIVKINGNRLKYFPMISKQEADLKNQSNWKLARMAASF
jgi:hypothetical protein